MSICTSEHRGAQAADCWQVTVGLFLGRQVTVSRSLANMWEAGAAWNCPSLWDARLSQVWGLARHPDVHVSFAPHSESIQGW